MNTYDLILFDLDETLLDFHDTQTLALSRALSRHGLPYDDQVLKRFQAVNVELWRRFEEGGISKREIFRQRFAALVPEADVERWDALNDVFLAELGANPKPFPGAVELCRDLGRCHRLGLVTNGDAKTQRLRQEGSGLAPLFHFVVISDDVGVSKPHPRIFQEALRRAELDERARVLMIGDNIRADVGGALGVGFDACWFNPKGVAIPQELEIAPTYTIRELDEVREIPGVLSSRP